MQVLAEQGDSLKIVFVVLNVTLSGYQKITFGVSAADEMVPIAHLEGLKVQCKYGLSID